MPNPLASGHIHLNYPSHPPSAIHSALSVFRPSDFPLGLIGVASCSQTDSLTDILAHFNAARNELFPSGSTYPLATNCFVFEEDDNNTQLNLGDTLPGLVVIPSMMGNKQLYVGTLLADLCSNILGEFATMVGPNIYNCEIGDIQPENTGGGSRKPIRQRVPERCDVSFNPPSLRNAQIS